MFEQTKALCAHFLKLGVPGFDLIVYKDGECVLRHMGGYADKENKVPMTGKEKYHIYSCSKLFTCTAAMQLWERGLFSLDDDLSDYLPAFKNMAVKTPNGVEKAKNPIKIHHLFEMTAGLNYDLKTPALLAYYEKENNPCPTLEVVDLIAQTPLEFEPGTSWKYSLCHDVLAALVEVLSGERFEDYVKTHIFLPLGMTHSDFLHPIEDWEGFARQYRYKAETGEFIPLWHNSYRPGKAYASGGAGCVSTVEDYIKFLEAMRVGDVILKRETIDLMSTDRLSEQQRAAYTYGTGGIGYGLGMRALRGDPKHTEFGWGGAAGAYALVDRQNGFSFYYAQHVISSPNRSLRSWLYQTLRADLFGESVEVPIHREDDDPTLTY